MTLEEFYKATESMPKNADIAKQWQLLQYKIGKVFYDPYNNTIVIC